MYKSFCISAQEPRAIDKKLVNSLSVLRSNPSAIFEPIETAARLIWEVNPNSSSLGNRFVKIYMSFVNFLAICQTGNSSKEFILTKN